jgi:hypothetical protein
VSAHITVVDNDGMTLRIMELVGDNAHEVARIRLRDTKPATITAVVANLLPFLAPAGHAPRSSSNGEVPRPEEPPRRSRQERMERARAYVEQHPGATITEIAYSGLGLRGGQGSKFHELLRDAGLRLEQERTGTGALGFRWRAYPAGGVMSGKEPSRVVAATRSPMKGMTQAEIGRRVTERKEALLAYIRDHPGTSGSAAMRALGWDPRGGESGYLQQLARDGRIRKEGERRDSKWYAT